MNSSWELTRISTWAAGGGVRPGVTVGAIDEIGFHPVERPIHVHDVRATMHRCRGIDHEQLAVRTNGLNVRLTGVEERLVVEELLS